VTPASERPPSASDYTEGVGIHREPLPGAIPARTEPKEGQASPAGATQLEAAWDPWLTELAASRLLLETPASRLLLEARQELARHWIGTHLPAAEISEITAMAERIFGDKLTALNWLRQPNLATDDKAPIDLLGAPDGFNRVKHLLLRIEYGVLA